MKKQDIIDTYDKYILSTYTRVPLIFVKGKGSILTDLHGKKYLDFFPGWGVANVGHCHPKVVNAIRDQIDHLIHIPNNLYSIPQAKLAAELIRCSFPGKVFYCNSGTEANEAAIKFARAYGEKSQRFEIITTERSFHGRTMGALAATGQARLQKGFGPMLEGFKTVAFNDLSAMKSAISDKTVAIMLELVQGEGGVNVATQEYVKGLRSLCDEHDVLLICDEVQTAMGRTGKMFAYQHYGITPDVMSVAKAFGGGVPIGAMVVQEHLADTFKPGMHGSTFAGSPLACKAALGVFKAIHQYKMLKNAQKMGEYFHDELNKLAQRFTCIKQVRGLGLMIGIELNSDGANVVQICLDHGLIINCTQGNILRMSPVLNVTRKQINRAVHILAQALESMNKGE